MRIFLLFTLFFTTKIYSQIDSLLNDLNPANFNLNFQDYNQKTALYCAQLSEVAYWSERNINILYNDIKKKHPDSNPNFKLIDDTYGIHHNQVLLWCNKNYLVVSFRGTEPSKIADWVTDSNYWNYENAEGWDDSLHYLPAGHGGFRRSVIRFIKVKNIMNEIQSIITKTNPSADLKKFPIYLTGHSLGAALSQLFIVPLKYNNFNFSGAYHFAPPLAVSCKLNEEFKTKYGNVTYDIVNYKDYVPRAGRNGVAHFGKFYRICDDQLIYKEEEAYVKFNFGEHFSEFKLHSIKSHILLIRKFENNTEKIVERSKGHFPCMELDGNPVNLCGE